MNKNPLVIINNEKIFRQGNDFYCDNVDMSIIPSEFKNFQQTVFIARKSIKKGGHKIELENTKPASNILTFFYLIFKTFKARKNSYLLIGVTPYTFFAFLILYIFRRKIFIYLRSSGHEEFKYLYGSWSVWIHHFMFIIVSNNSSVIVNNSRLYKEKKCHLINSSRLDELWFKNRTISPLEKIKFLYVGRVSREKGIFDFIKMIDNVKINFHLSIVGNSKNLKFKNNNIKLLGYISETESLIKVYDEHNITVLPSFTEGQPLTIDESLSRNRPVIIFEDINYVVKERKGIFISKRNINSFIETTQYVINNYQNIQEDIKKNKFTTKRDMVKQISDIIG